MSSIRRAIIEVRPIGAVWAVCENRWVFSVAWKSEGLTDGGSGDEEGNELIFRSESFGSQRMK